MSLLDSMLLEGYRDPREVWIALRTDGQKGIGTIADPYDGGNHADELRSASLTLDRKEVIFSTTLAHGYSTGQSIAILDISGPSASIFNATFSIVVLTNNDFKIILGSVPTDPPGNVDNARSGSVDSALLASLSHSSSLSEFMDVTVTTNVNHAYANGDTVQIAGATGDGRFWFNGTFLIEGVTAGEPKQFRYKLTKPGVPAAGANGQSVTSTRIHTKPGRLSWPVAKVTTTPSHHYLAQEIVAVAGSGNPIFDGEFFILVSKDDTFYYRLATVPALDASYNGLNCSRLIYRFDEVMRSLMENTAIHLGPGIFQTRGFDPGRSEQLNWTIRAGQRILGSGMGVTTLKLMHAVPFVPSVTSQQLTLAMGHSWNTSPFVANVDHFEVSDLTVDCNMRSQIADRVAKAAVLAFGRHVRIRRVRAVDYSTQSSPVECFVLSTAGADPRISATGADPNNPFTERVDCRIEDCVLEQPGLDGLYTITGLLLNTGERPDTGEMGWHRACVERNNYINFEYQDNPVSIASITIASGTATVTTRTPHGRNTGDYVVISGVLVDGSELNTFNGSYPVTRINDYSFTYVLVAYSGLLIPTTNPTGDMWVGRFSSRFLAIAQITTIPSNPSPSSPTRRVRITLSRPHNRTPSNYVNVLAVKANGFTDDTFNGRFAIKAVSSPVELEFDIDEDIMQVVAFPASGLIGGALQALSGEGGTEALLEGNRVFHCWVGGSYHDTWASKDLLIRNNYYHDVLIGPYQSIGPGVSGTDGVPLIEISVAVVGPDIVATALSTGPHGLRPLIDKVTVLEATGDPNVPLPAYNRSEVLVQAVPTSVQFQYLLETNPVETAISARYLIAERQKLIESLSRASDGTGYIVTARTTYARHGFIKGDAVQIIRAGHANLGQYPQSTLYNGSFTIIDVPDSKTFRYRIASDPGVDSSNANFAAGYFGRIWQSRISDYEDNVVELSSRFGDEGTPAAIAVSQSHNGTTRTEPYTYLQFMARGNVVRAVDERYGLVHSSLSSAVIAYSCEKVLVDGNIIDLAYSTPISFFRSGAVQTTYNQTPAGAPIRGLDYDTNSRTDDMTTLLEDVQTLILL